MSQKNDTLPLLIALVLTLGILGGGAWWFLNRSPTTEVDLGENSEQPTGEDSANLEANSFEPAATVAEGTTIVISGSTSMVTINEALKNRFELQYPGTSVISSATGSSEGINDLLTNTADIAAISRPLSEEEQKQGLRAVPVATDAIAIVISKSNPLSKGLTTEQVKAIFQGSITEWSDIGNTNNGDIRVINRPEVSGTREAFQELVLEGTAFGTGSNFTTLERDATTPLLQALKTDGIGYATYSQVNSQQTIRTVPIQGVTPESDSYPYLRPLYYVYKEPASPEASAFLGFAGTPAIKDVIKAAQE
ncbi:MAG: phosphate ABC transporter substrate-binding protein [Limnothrix sp.]